MPPFPESDLKCEAYSSFRDIPGCSNGIKITHLPTGTVVKCEAESRAYDNRKHALVMLEEVLSEEPNIVVMDTSDFLRACDPCAKVCQYASDIGFPEYRCSPVCQYARHHPDTLECSPS